MQKTSTLLSFVSFLSSQKMKDEGQFISRQRGNKGEILVAPIGTALR